MIPWYPAVQHLLKHIQHTHPDIHRSTITLVLFAALIAARCESSAQIVRDSLWVTNGVIAAVNLDGNTMYVGGSFSEVGPSTGGGVLLDSVTGRFDPQYPQVNGFVKSAVPDGSGGWYIGGGFDNVGGVTRKNLAHIRSDKTVDPHWNPRANSFVGTLARSGNTLYVAGGFTEIGTRSRRFLAAIPTTSGTPTAWDPQPNWPVISIAIKRGIVYVGGNFTWIGGAERHFIAAIDSVTGTATEWNPDIGGGTFPSVDCISLLEDTVYAGGEFLTVGGEPRSYIAAIEATTGEPTSWNPSANGAVLSLFASPAEVYAGGWFSTIGGLPRSGLAAIDTKTGIATDWNPSPAGGVRSLAVTESTVFFGGDFLSVAGVERQRIAGVDRVSGRLTGWNPHSGDMVFVVAAKERDVYAGGAFTCMNATSRRAVAAIDATTGRPTEWNPIVTGESRSVYCIATTDSTVYLGGSFLALNGSLRNNVGAVSKSTGETLSWNPDADGLVASMVVSGNTIFVQGDFRQIGGQSRTTVAALDRLTGEVLPWDPKPDDVVRAITLSGSTVFLGGYFRTLGETPRLHIGAVDAVTGAPTNWNPGANDIVMVLLARGRRIYLGGAFTAVGGADRNRIAAVDRETGMVTDWNPDADNDVYALAAADRYVYAGGIFTSIASRSRNYIASIDSATGVSSGWNPDLNEYALSLTASGNMIYAGGAFKSINHRPHSFFAAIQDESFAPTVSVTVDPSWNLVSVPLLANDYQRISIFPLSNSQAFQYRPGGGYTPTDLLANGPGYWLKFPVPATVPMFGGPLIIDTADVSAGWNLIGSVTNPVPVASIGSIPGGIVTSPFYTYGPTGYQRVSTLTPGKGHWVRADQPGLLVISASPLTMGRIRIVSTEEMPPAPPGEVTAENKVEKPREFTLGQNYPNPFNPTTTIEFSLPKAGYVTLTVYNLFGQRIATLLSKELQPGKHKVPWEATGVASGVYFYRLKAGETVQTRRLILLK